MQNHMHLTVSDMFTQQLLTKKLKIIISFLKENISNQIILLTHFEVLIKPKPSERGGEESASCLS